MTIPRESAVRIGHFFRALDRRNHVSRDFCDKNGIDYRSRAAGEGTSSAGGFLVPEDFEPSVSMAGMLNSGVFRANTNVHRTTSGYQTQPRFVGGLTAYFTAEGAVPTQSSFTLGAIDVSLKRLSILGTMSSSLFEDADVGDLGAFLATQINYAMGIAEDDCFFNGDGTSTYGGITGIGNALAGLKSAAVCAGTHNTLVEVDSTDIGSVVALVQSSALPNAAWYVSPSVYGLVIARLSVLTGGLIATKNPDGTFEANYLGYRVIVSEKAPNGVAATDFAGLPMLFLGDASRSSVLVERGPTDIGLSWGRLLDQDSVMIRATRRIDIVHPGIGTAADRGAMAVLLGTT